MITFNMYAKMITFNMYAKMIIFNMYAKYYKKHSIISISVLYIV